MADTDLLTMPPVGSPYEPDEERKQRLIRLAGGMRADPMGAPQPSSRPPSAQPLPPVNAAPQPHPIAAAPPSTMPPAVARPLEGTEKNLAVNATNPPNLPPIKPLAPPEAPQLSSPNALPPVKPPMPQGEPARPSGPVGPQQERYEEFSNQPRPELHGWKKALDAIGAIFPLGQAIEKAIPGSPQNYDAKLNQAGMRAAKEQSLAKGEGEERRATEEFPVQQRLRTAQAREAEGRADQLENPGEAHQDIVKEFSDALAKNDQKRIDELAPRVKQYMEGTQKPQKEPVENEKAKDIADYLEANKLPDTAANREKARGAIAQRSKPEVSSTDAKDIAAAIQRGDQPPTTTGLYRNAAAVRAELARSGFNLAQAESDWHATQKHLGTMNGAQQERLRQAVSFTNDSLSIIEDLYGQWQKAGPASGWKIFNKGGLEAAKQLPGEAGNIAHRLEAQINDLTSELGTVYKGGNSSTDESLKLASGNLKAEWNEKTFKQAIEQIRKNLEIRQNSIRHSQPAGVSANSPYTPENEKQAEPPRAPREGMKWQKNRNTGEFREVPLG